MLKKALQFLDSTFKSVPFAIGLMLVIGVASVYGTLFPPKTPFDFNPYKSPFFIFLLFVFAANIGYCAYSRLLKIWKARQDPDFPAREVMRSRALPDAVIQSLQKKGFSVESQKNGFRAKKGTIRSASVLMIHAASVLFLACAGISSLAGFLGTVNVHVNDRMGLVFDWNKKADIILPFEIFPTDLEVDYYPMPLKILVEDVSSKTNERFTTAEKAEIPYKGGMLKILKAYPLEKKLLFTYRTGGTEYGPFTNMMSHGGKNTAIKILAYIDPIPRQFYVTINIIKQGQPVAQKRIHINNPMTYEGYSIYLLEINRDKYGLDYVGFQITKEPLSAGIWLFSILLCAALVAFPLFREYHIRGEIKDGELILYAHPAMVNEEDLKKIIGHELL